jgi:N,N'-diacetyllegionaminate synthase
MTMRTVPVGSQRIGEGEPVFILAEIASAHQGQPDLAVTLARAAQEAGASGVKLQLFRAAELLAPDDPRMETFAKIELSIAQWERVLDDVGALEMPVFADVFDRPSLRLGESRGVQAYKIHSTDMENPQFIREVAATGKPILFSTGGCELNDVEAAIEAAQTEGNGQIVLLHGVQNFPTRIEDSNLRFIGVLKEKFDLPVGFLDHVDGASPMATVLPTLARAFGADLIEKHIILNRGSKGFDYESALEPKVFGEMVGLLRDADSAFTVAVEGRDGSSERYHKMMRRAVLSREVLPKGEPVRAEQIALVRNDTGLAPKHAAAIVGRRPRRDIPAWRPLTEDLFE